MPSASMISVGLNCAIAGCLFGLAAVNLAFNPFAPDAFASSGSPCLGEPPCANCQCCEECGCWICDCGDEHGEHDHHDEVDDPPGDDDGGHDEHGEHDEGGSSDPGPGGSGGGHDEHGEG